MDRAETHCQRLTVAEENINGLYLQKVIVQIRKQRLRIGKLLRGLPAPHPIPFQHKMVMHLVPSSPFYSENRGVWLKIKTTCSAQMELKMPITLVLGTILLYPLGSICPTLSSHFSFQS